MLEIGPFAMPSHLVECLEIASQLYHQNHDCLGLGVRTGGGTGSASGKSLVNTLAEGRGAYEAESKSVMDVVFEVEGPFVSPLDQEHQKGSTPATKPGGKRPAAH